MQSGCRQRRSFKLPSPVRGFPLWAGRGKDECTLRAVFKRIVGERGRTLWKASAPSSSGAAAVSAEPLLMRFALPENTAAYMLQAGRSEEHTSELQSQSNL